VPQTPVGSDGPTRTMEAPQAWIVLVRRVAGRGGLGRATPRGSPENAPAWGTQREEHAPGGKSACWQANPATPSRDMPVESFSQWELKPYLPPVYGKGIRALSSPSSRACTY